MGTRNASSWVWSKTLTISVVRIPAQFTTVWCRSPSPVTNLQFPGDLIPNPFIEKGHILNSYTTLTATGFSLYDYYSMQGISGTTLYSHLSRKKRKRSFLATFRDVSGDPSKWRVCLMLPQLRLTRRSPCPQVGISFPYSLPRSTQQHLGMSLFLNSSLSL